MNQMTDFSSQILLPVGVSTTVTVAEIARLKTFGGAMQLCAAAAGFELDKEVQLALKVDKGQASRWKNGQEGIKEEKFNGLQDFCGNDIPLLYLNYQRGYDIASMRKRESETDAQLRKEKERADAAEAELKILRKYVNGLRPGDN